MYKPSIRTVGLLVLAFAWTLALAGSSAALNARNAPAANDDARNTSDQGVGIGASVQQPGVGGQDVITWANKAVIPTEGVSRTAGCWSADGMFHLICGNCQTHTSHPTDQIYNPTSNSWADGLTHPVGGGLGVHNHDACIIGDTIYVGGGSSGAAFYDNLTAIDVTGNTWTVLTAMPAASLLYYSFAACNGKVYCFGGTTDQSTCLSTAYEYDPAGGSWTAKTAMPDIRRNAVCATWGDTIYVIGGFSTMAYNGTTTMWKFCPSTDSWTTGTAFSAGTGWGRGVVYNDPALGPVVYVIGGYNAAGAIVNTVSTYIVNTGVWGSETPEIGGRRSHAAGISSDGKVFVAGGYNGAILATTEMATLAPAASADVGVSVVLAPAAFVDPGATISPQATIRNYGTSPQGNIPVYCHIDSAGTTIYNHNFTYVGPLAPSGTADVTFSPAWTAGMANFAYSVKMFTALSNDSFRSNDTLVQSSTVFMVRDTLVAPLATSTPTIDGVIAPGEWTDALSFDVSDILGMEGTPKPAGSAILYVKHDVAYVYYAVDLPSATTRVDYDQVGCYVDENYDRAWATDSSEGNHWFVYLSGADTTLYRSEPSYWTRWSGPPPNGLCHTSLASGHLQFEAVVNKGTNQWDYTINPGEDTVGFYMYAANTGGANYLGHWPTAMPGASWNDPTAYGTLILSASIAAVHEDARVSVPAARFTVGPNPAAGAALIHYSVGRAGRVSLKLYDVTGKLVSTLVNGDVNAGSYQTTVDASRLARGIYLIKFATDNNSATGKLVIE